MKYAWFTVGLPEWTPEETVRELKKAGYDGVEWRVTRDEGSASAPSFWKGNRCTLQEDWPLARFREVARMTADAGLTVPNLGSYCMASEPARVGKMMEVAALFKAPTLRVGAGGYDGKEDYNRIFERGLEQYRRVIELGIQYKVRPLVEIHMNTIAPSASAVRRFVGNFPADRVGVIHDAGNMVYEGFENYRMGLEILGDYLAHVHIKNTMPCSEKAEPPRKLRWTVAAAPLREGAVDFEALMKALKGKGYDGWLSIEDFSLSAPQAEKVADNLAFLKQTERKAS